MPSPNDKTCCVPWLWQQMTMLSSHGLALHQWVHAALAGFAGTYCQVNVDDCQPMPCSNHIECVDLVDDYRCECTPGFSGTICRELSLYCKLHTCVVRVSLRKHPSYTFYIQLHYAKRCWGKPTVMKCSSPTRMKLVHFKKRDVLISIHVASNWNT